MTLHNKLIVTQLHTLNGFLKMLKMLKDEENSNINKKMNK